MVDFNILIQSVSLLSVSGVNAIQATLSLLEACVSAKSLPIMSNSL